MADDPGDGSRRLPDIESPARGDDVGAGDEPLQAAAAPTVDTQLTIHDDAPQPNDGNTSRFRWIIDEESRFIFWYSNLLAILAIHSSLIKPLVCAFEMKDIPTWIRASFEILFFFDVIRQWICLVTSMENHGYQKIIEMLHHPRKILEAIPFIPWSYLIKSNNVEWFKIIRSLRVKELFEKLEHFQRYYSIIKFTKLLCMELFCVHISGCMLYQLATTSLPENQTWLSNTLIGDRKLSELGIAQKYIASVYFATVTLSTIGFGDIHAFNVEEMVAIVCLQIFGLIVWTYLGVQLASLYTRRSKSDIVSEKLNKLKKKLRTANVSEGLSRKIIDHMIVQYKQDYDKIFTEDIPPAMRTKIIESIIARISLFQGCSPGFIKHMATEFREEFYAPGHSLVDEGSFLKELKILICGKLRQLQGEVILQDQILPNTIIGVEFLVLDMAIPTTFEACELSTVLELNRRVFLESLEHYYHDSLILIQNLERGEDVNFREQLKLSEFGSRLQNVTRASMLHNAVYSGNFKKVKALIEMGIDVNCTDYNKRSALHVAAIQGNVEIAAFLMAQGARADIQDVSGRTPFMEAVRYEDQSKHEGILKILLFTRR